MSSSNPKASGTAYGRFIPREELDSRGPVRVSEVEAEQKEMLKTVRRMVDEGTIVMGGGGDDAFV